MASSTAPAIDIRLLPDISIPVMDFHDTSFFNPASSTSPIPQLPTPALVRKEGEAQGRTTVKFEHLNLFVKFGDPSRVRLEEAQTIRAIGQAFSKEDVPVPELFGWRVDQGENFIYMSLIEGTTLGVSWPLLTEEEKKSITAELGQIMAHVRRIVQQPSTQPIIGSINTGRVQDNYFRDEDDAGPFHSVAEFNDQLQLAAYVGLLQSGQPEDPYRAFLTDTCNISFSHGDLNLYNIIVSNTPIRRVVGVIDWEQAGWYPEYWEYCKLKIPGPFTHQWHEDGWSDSIVTPCEEEWSAVSEYWLWKCP